MKLIPKSSIYIKLRKFAGGGKSSSTTSSGKMVRQKPSERKGKYSDRQQFVTDLYRSFYRQLRSRGIDKEKATRLSYYKVMQTALESNWGSHPQADYSYGGLNGGVVGRGVRFNSMDDYTNGWINNSDERWPDWKEATNFEDYIRRLSTGLYQYGGEPFEMYYPKFKGMDEAVRRHTQIPSVTDIDMGYDY